MTVKELHVNFDIAAQEVNSNRFDEVTSEEGYTKQASLSYI